MSQVCLAVGPGSAESGGMQVVPGVASAAAMLRSGLRPALIVTMLIDHVGLSEEEAEAALDFACRANALGWPLP